MVSYKGSFIDIAKLLDQMKRSEKARSDTEQLLVDLRKTNADLASTNSRNKERIRDLQSDVKSYSRKLSDAESSLSSSQVRNCSHIHPLIYHHYNKCSVLCCRKKHPNTIRYCRASTIECRSCSPSHHPHRHHHRPRAIGPVRINAAIGLPLLRQPLQSNPTPRRT